MDFANTNYMIIKHSAVPATTRQLPEDYVEKVKRVHESGGYGSKGYVLLYWYLKWWCRCKESYLSHVHYRYGYDWKRDEAEKNLLRTHTTAVSTRMLYMLAQQVK